MCFNIYNYFFYSFVFYTHTHIHAQTDTCEAYARSRVLSLIYILPVSRDTYNIQPFSNRTFCAPHNLRVPRHFKYFNELTTLQTSLDTYKLCKKLIDAQKVVQSRNRKVLLEHCWTAYRMSMDSRGVYLNLNCPPKVHTHTHKHKYMSRVTAAQGSDSVRSERTRPVPIALCREQHTARRVFSLAANFHANNK